MINVAIVEDEEREARTLERYVERYAKERSVEIQASLFSDGLGFLDSMRRMTYDIVLMDIQMPLIDGMSAARRMREQDHTAVLMFVTNMVQYAVEGYEVEASAFIVKPVSYPDFSFKFEKAVATALRNGQGGSIVLMSGSKVKRIRVSDILYAESIKHSIVWHTADGDYMVWNRPMSDVEREMKGYGFARCNSGYLVNLGRVETLTADSVTVGGAVLPISRGRRKPFLEAFAAYGGGV